MPSRQLCLACCLAGTSLLAAGPSALAATDDAGAAPPFNVVVSQRFWNATWDQAVIDMVVTAPPTADALPQVRAGLQKNVSRRMVPITALGLRYGSITASVSHFGTQRFDGNGLYVEPDVRRDETDLSLGYQLLPGLSLALIRKVGNASSSQTRGTTELIGGDTPNKGRATLIGFSASVPINDQVVLYGNLAYGPGKFIDPTGTYTPTKARYAVSEIGFAYRFGLTSPVLGLDAVSVQAGYRTQAISYAGLEVTDFEGLPAEVTVSRSKARSVTDGFIVSVSLIF